MFDAQDLQQRNGTSEGTPPPAKYASGHHVHLLDRLSGLFRHRRAAGAAFTIIVALVMLQTYSKIPLYQASARVVIQDERTMAVGTLNANDPMFWKDPQ